MTANKQIKLNTSDVIDLGLKILKFRAYLFIVLVLGCYSFITLQIHSLTNVAPGTPSNASTVSAATTNITVNKSIVSQIQSLQNNNVSVQSLFEQARSNPFIDQ